MDKKTRMMQLARQWKESGLSRPAYAQQHGITIRSLEYWCRKQKKEQDRQSSAPSFIELVSNASLSQAKRQAQIELELSSGLRIKIY
jgi:hypothetical protein